MMKDRNLIVFAATLLTLFLVGCDSAEQSSAPPAAENSSAEKVVDATDGFFTDMPMFLEETEIRKIGAKEDQPKAYLERLNTRYGLIIDHHRDLIKGAKILDFGSYDGRWAYAALDAGAKQVTGIEINQDFVDQANGNMEALQVSPDSYEFIVGDLLTELRKIEPGSYDGIICAGIYYHITYHVELMNEMKRLGVDWIIMDSAVVQYDKPVVQWSYSPYGLEGTPSVAAIKMIAESVGFKHTQLKTDNFGSDGMWDYDAGGRVTMTLTPDDAA